MEGGGKELLHMDKLLEALPTKGRSALQFIPGQRNDEVLLQLNLKDYKTNKLTLQQVLSVGDEVLRSLDLNTPKGEAWSFLRKLIALDETARNTRPWMSDLSRRSLFTDEEEDFDCNPWNRHSCSIHPLDVLCAVLHSSDHFLQQEIISKMSTCQFAVPLLLPSGEGKQYTLMLWTMRDIVKKWRPWSLLSTKGFKEESLVHIAMPTFSFVRLGQCLLSKSRILNQTLSPTYTHHDFFVHRDQECGYKPKEISDGLVEIAWYFPGGRETSDIFPEPIAVTNLRGDLKSKKDQLSFMAQVSSAVFVFTEDIDEEKYKLLLNSVGTIPNCYFIICPADGKRASEETKKILAKLCSELNLNKKNVFVKDPQINEAALVKHLQNLIRNVIRKSPKQIKLEAMAEIAGKFNFKVDENAKECQKAKQRVLEITSRINDIGQYKRETMKLQDKFWKQVTKNEKELCRMREQGDRNGENYRSELIKQNVELRRAQNQQILPDGIGKFGKALNDLAHVEKLYFLKWMKFELGSKGRKTLSILQNDYKKMCNHVTSMDQLNKKDQDISESSLGIEHFLRELGQFYEAEWFTAKDGTLKMEQKRFRNLPGVAADLLLDGFPLELMDGDSSNIPLQWVTDVLTELDNKTGGKCRMRVITVLGVQSTGKSTLLNTMFGLQFPVASGRCTRGAFMTFIKVKEDFQKELDCVFILVIDTEGLKAPELASIDGSHEHDNELATLVVGLSDITIINMAMENTTEIRDTLQIVVHAFLRMKEVGKKPSCQFVHHNVSDVSAHQLNMRDRKKLLDQLDEMTRAAAKMEKRGGITAFSDIMTYDLEEQSWYIPGLWQGVPPMAPINSGYSENISILKRHMFETLKTKLKAQKPQNIHSFLTWVKSLWKAVKHEKFLFSFRNSLVAEAYDQLSMKYSELEWTFRKGMYNWMTEMQTAIKNHKTELQTNAIKDYEHSMRKTLEQEEKTMSALLEAYFEGGSDNINLVERYREDFFRSIKNLTKELERYLNSKLSEAVRIQREMCKIQDIQNSCIKTIEGKVDSLLKYCKSRQVRPSDMDLTREFDTMWQGTIEGLDLRPLEKHIVGHSMLQQLKKELSNKGGYINKLLVGVTSLSDSQEPFVIKDKYLDLAWYEKCINTMWYKVAGLTQDYYKQEYCYKIETLVDVLTDRCSRYVMEKFNSQQDYHETFCHELLNMVNEQLQKKEVRDIHATDCLELDLKLRILGTAAPRFQAMHNYFLQSNDPARCLESLRSRYFLTFKDIFQEKDQSRNRARQFCEQCLRPALLIHIKSHLGNEIVTDILTSVDSIKYNSRMFFQYTVLKKLLEDKKFDQYVKYINNYELFVKNWIVSFIKDKYRTSGSTETLQTRVLSDVMKKVKSALRDPDILQNTRVSDFLADVCETLKTKLVISPNDLKVVLFQNSAPVEQFSTDIQSFLNELESEIVSEVKGLSVQSILDGATVKPEDELFKRVFGCGKQCPFCKVPCEAGAGNHKEHFASVHRPKGLGRYRFVDTGILNWAVCSTEVLTDRSFQNSDTDWKPHPYKEYRAFYPDWRIQPDASISASDYWKFILKEYNQQFANEYKAKPAEIPEDWNSITEEQALQSLMETFLLMKD
ncbi:up-regulator of cell proliferation [Xenopus tropicalis]|uniref:Up-regulator of cell proliferation n=1 Tax=Xenopus tropicalis TaxID=8364 RepID=A0A803KBZ9_XENTR|nr:up-regulator of cell proliferation [Xenopus tropicalis]XP_031749460.1 up-regulator of cell proliferation [Xenopus tropicalis]